MKKNSLFVTIVILCALVASYLIYYFILGNPSHFTDALKTKPVSGDYLGTAYVGGFIVPWLMTLTIMVLTFILERFFSLAKAKGTGDLSKFLSGVENSLNEGNVDGAIELCAKQRGTVANILRAGLESFKKVRNESRMESEVKLEEVKRTIEEATSIETPLLERNLIGLSTIASISTMVGLLGTVLGMIRAFSAMGAQGAASATELSIGISEALVNTALGILSAIIAIIFYNFFTNKVDGFVYTIDEAALNLVEQLDTRFLAKKAA
jgi:biopolymer transport protein ExbB